MLSAMIRLALVCILGFVSVAPAQAQPETDEAESELQEGGDAEARLLYAEGKTQYASGRYVEAIVLFERAYTLSGAPALLFNLAQAHRLAGDAHCTEALTLYHSYLDALPRAENRREVLERIAQLEQCVARTNEAAQYPPDRTVDTASEATADTLRTADAPHAPSQPPTPPPSKAPTSTNAKRRWAAIVGGTGALLLVAGGALYARAAAEYTDAERNCPCYPGTFRKWDNLTTTSYALLGAGGAMGIAGLTWWLSAKPPTRTEAAQLTLTTRF